MSSGKIKWSKIKYFDSLSFNDQVALRKLQNSGKKFNWVDFIPTGLKISYERLHRAVKGVNCEDESYIERDVVRTDRVATTVKNRAKYKKTNSGPLKRIELLRFVLRSVAIIDDMGYCQGMNYVADFFLEATEENELNSFCVFLYALRNLHLCCLYETRLPVLSLYMDVYAYQLSQYRPSLSRKLMEEGFLAPYYAIEWFTTCFTLYVPLPLTVAVLQLWLAGAENIFLRVGLAIMSVLEDELMKLSIENLLINFRNLVLTVKAEKVIETALQIQLVKFNLSDMPTTNEPVALPVSAEQVAAAMGAERDTFLPCDAMQIQSLVCTGSDDVLLWLRNTYLHNAAFVRRKRCQEWREKIFRHDCYKELIFERSQISLLSMSSSPTTSSGNTEPKLPRISDTPEEAEDPKDSALENNDVNDCKTAECRPREYGDSFQLRDSSFLCYEHDDIVDFDPPPAPQSRSVTVEKSVSEMSPRLFSWSRNRKTSLESTAETICSGKRKYIMPNMCDRTSFWDRVKPELEDIIEFGRNSTCIEKWYQCSCAVCRAVNKFKADMLVASKICGWTNLHKSWLKVLAMLSVAHYTTPHNILDSPVPSSRVKKSNEDRVWKQVLIANHLLSFGIVNNCDVRVIGFLLLISGADVNSQNSLLMTPLHVAAKFQRVDILRLFLLCGADRSILGSLQSNYRYMLTAKQLAVLESEQVDKLSILSSSIYSDSIVSMAVFHDSLDQPDLSPSPTLTILSGGCCVVCSELLLSAYASCAASAVTCEFCLNRLCPSCASREHWCFGLENAVTAYMCTDTAPAIVTPQAQKEKRFSKGLSYLLGRPSHSSGDTNNNESASVTVMSTDTPSIQSYGTPSGNSKSNHAEVIIDLLEEVPDSCSNLSPSGHKDVTRGSMEMRDSSVEMQDIRNAILSRDSNPMPATAEVNVTTPIVDTKHRSLANRLTSKVQKRLSVSKELIHRMLHREGEKSHASPPNKVNAPGTPVFLFGHPGGFDVDAKVESCLSYTQQYLMPLLLGAEGRLGTEIMEGEKKDDSAYNIVTLYSKYVLQTDDVLCPQLLNFSTEICRMYCNLYTFDCLRSMLLTLTPPFYSLESLKIKRKVEEIIHFIVCTVLNLQVPIAFWTLKLSAERSFFFNSLVYSSANYSIHFERNSISFDDSVDASRFGSKLGRILVQKTCLNSYYYAMLKTYIDKGMVLSILRNGELVPTVGSRLSIYRMDETGDLVEGASVEISAPQPWYCGECATSLLLTDMQGAPVLERYTCSGVQRCDSCCRGFCSSHPLVDTTLMELLMSGVDESKKQYFADNFIEIVSTVIANISLSLVEQRKSSNPMSISKDFLRKFNNPSLTDISGGFSTLFRRYMVSKKADDEVIHSDCEAALELCQYLAGTNVEVQEKGKKDGYQRSCSLASVICKYLLSNGLIDSPLRLCKHCKNEYVLHSSILSELENSVSQISNNFWEAHLGLQNGDVKQPVFNFVCPALVSPS